MGFLKIQLPKNRIYGLDFMRASAIFLVLIGHSRGYLPESLQSFINVFLIDGVAVFFVLSGFLIGGILIRDFEKALSVGAIINFWTRRWLRTLPNYLFTLLCLLLLPIIFSSSHFDFGTAIKYALFLQNFSYPMSDFFPESWSLAVEEWFYLLIPLVIFAVGRINTKIKLKTNLLGVIFLIIISVILIRLSRYLALNTKNYHVYDRYFLRQVITRIDSIMFGILGAWSSHYYPNIFKKNKIVQLILGIVIILTVHNFESKKDYVLYVFSFSLTSVGVLITIPFLSQWKKSKHSLFNKAIIYFSIISYSLYLTNLSIVDFWILRNFPVNNITKFLLFWILTIFISNLLYKYIEQPLISYRDRHTKH